MKEREWRGGSGGEGVLLSLSYRFLNTSLTKCSTDRVCFSSCSSWSDKSCCRLNGVGVMS